MVKTALVPLLLAVLSVYGQGQPGSGSPVVHNRWAAWGDSLTAGNEDNTGVTYPGVLSSIKSVSVYNGGVGGQTSTQIAARMLVAPIQFSLWSSYICQIIWAGTNNQSAPATVLADIASMVAALPNPSCYLVLGILNGENQPSGSGGYNQVVTLNQDLTAAYPHNYLDIRALLVAAATSNPVDVVDKSLDIPAYTMRATGGGSLTAAIADTSTCTFGYSLTGVPSGNVGGIGSASGADILLVDSEYIYINAVTGTGPWTVSGCVRGYAGSVAVTHLNGASIVDTTNLHLGGTTGYTFVAQQVAAWLAANAGH